MGAILRLGDPAKAFWHTRSVARALGLSLSEAMAEGALSADGYAQMVTRCRACPAVGDCELWLARNGAGASEAPECCSNAALLNGLKH